MAHKTSDAPSVVRRDFAFSGWVILNRYRLSDRAVYVWWSRGLIGLRRDWLSIRLSESYWRGVRDGARSGAMERDVAIDLLVRTQRAIGGGP